MLGGALHAVTEFACNTPAHGNDGIYTWQADLLNPNVSVIGCPACITKQLLGWHQYSVNLGVKYLTCNCIQQCNTQLLGYQHITAINELVSSK